MIKCSGLTPRSSLPYLLDLSILIGKLRHAPLRSTGSCARTLRHNLKLLSLIPMPDVAVEVHVPCFGFPKVQQACRARIGPRLRTSQNVVVCGALLAAADPSVLGAQAHKAVNLDHL